MLTQEPNYPINSHDNYINIFRNKLHTFFHAYMGITIKARNVNLNSHVKYY